MPFDWSSDVCRSEEHTSELQSHDNLVCRLLLEKKLTPAVDKPPHFPPVHTRPRVHLVAARVRASGSSTVPPVWGRVRVSASLFFFLMDGAPRKLPPFPPPPPLRV